jgi:hypothetical protein
MAIEEAEHLAIGEDLAAVVIVGVALVAQHRLVHQLPALAAQHGDGTGVDEPTHPGRISVIQQGASAEHVGGVQLRPVPPAGVGIAEIGRRVEDDVHPCEHRREGIYRQHVADHELHRQPGELPLGLGGGAHQRPHPKPLHQQFAHQVVA